MVIIKSRVDTSGDGNWLVYVNAGDVDETDYLLLNFPNRAEDEAGAFNDTAATTTTFSLGTFVDLNESSKTYIAYCFANIEGYSKVGSFSGNNAADGTFVYTGFRPAWIMTKSSGTGGTNYDWVIFDNKRNTSNVSDAYIDANLALGEVTSGRNEIDILSNGFKCRSSYGDLNSNTTYIYLAFAEQPFKYANAR